VRKDQRYHCPDGVNISKQMSPNKRSAYLEQYDSVIMWGKSFKYLGSN
jgi:hypothetical protein